MSLNRARAEQPAAEVAASAVVLIGQAHLGAGALLAQGMVLRSRAGAVALGNHSAAWRTVCSSAGRSIPSRSGNAPSSAIAPPS